MSKENTFWSKAFIIPLWEWKLSHLDYHSVFPSPRCMTDGIVNSLYIHSLQIFTGLNLSSDNQVHLLMKLIRLAGTWKNCDRYGSEPTLQLFIWVMLKSGALRSGPLLITMRFLSLHCLVRMTAKKFMVLSALFEYWKDCGVFFSLWTPRVLFSQNFPFVVIVYHVVPVIPRSVCLMLQHLGPDVATVHHGSSLFLSE